MNRETTSLKKEEIVRKWYVVDATDKPLGRLASEIAVYLMGKEKPSWTPNQDCGDYIIVVNCEKVKMLVVITVVYVLELLRICLKDIQRNYLKELFGVCFQKEDSEDKCIRNYLSTKVLNTNTLLKTQKS